MSTYLKHMEAIVNPPNPAPVNPQAPAQGPVKPPDTGAGNAEPDSALPLGLSEAEASRRLAAGKGNVAPLSTGRTYGRILADNALSTINVIVFAVGVALIAMGLFNDALVTVGLVLANILIAVGQEARAKRALDRIAVLTRPRATVVREGREREIDPEGVVEGDILVAGPGDQAVVDGSIVADGRAQVDESLLTGESEPVAKAVGDRITAGSFCVSGRVIYRAERVGAASVANILTARARAFRQTKTPVQREVELILRVMVILVLMIGGPIVLDFAIRMLGTLINALDAPMGSHLDRAYQGYSVQESVRAAAVVVGLVPQGLALMLTVTYALGAARLAGKGALLQQANAIESLSHVDVLCLDKTGTLTTNCLTFCDAHPIGMTLDRLAALLGTFAASATARTGTLDAIAAAFPCTARAPEDEVVFSSKHKWSALAFSPSDRDPIVVLGAPEVLLPRLDEAVAVERQVRLLAETGLRVVLLATSAGPLPLHDTRGEPQLPASLRPAGLVALRDELQPGAADAVQQFASSGIRLKVISGDHPETVAALAGQAGFGRHHELRAVSGLDLAAMDDALFAQAAEENDVFGRITPDQKFRLIECLQAKRYYVAMVGDGVNDVLALKQAQVGVAMEGGSQATRAVADLVLRGNSFAVLPAAFREGQRIVRGAQDLIKLFLARSLSVAVAIVGAGVIGAPFPVTPTHNAIPALLVVGIPTIALAAWTHPGPVPRDLLRSVLPFVLPAALTLGATEGIVYVSYLRATDDLTLARTAMTAVAVVAGLLLILFLRSPGRGHQRGGDWRPAGLVAAMLVLFFGAMASDGIRDFFDLARFGLRDYAIVAGAVMIWAVLMWWASSRGVIGRWIGVEQDDCSR